jgi:hypothetical protein
VEGDGVAEGLQLADVLTDLAGGVGAGGVVVRAEVDECVSSSESSAQMMTRMERPTATIARFLPRRRAMRR